MPAKTRKVRLSKGGKQELAQGLIEWLAGDGPPAAQPAALRCQSAAVRSMVAQLQEVKARETARLPSAEAGAEAGAEARPEGDGGQGRDQPDEAPTLAPEGAPLRMLALDDLGPINRRMKGRSTFDAGTLEALNRLLRKGKWGVREIKEVRELGEWGNAKEGLDYVFLVLNRHRAYARYFGSALALVPAAPVGAFDPDPFGRPQKEDQA